MGKLELILAGCMFGGVLLPIRTDAVTLKPKEEGKEEVAEEAEEIDVTKMHIMGKEIDERYSFPYMHVLDYNKENNLILFVYGDDMYYKVNWKIAVASKDFTKNDIKTIKKGKTYSARFCSPEEIIVTELVEEDKPMINQYVYLFLYKKININTLEEKIIGESNVLGLTEKILKRDILGYRTYEFLTIKEDITAEGTGRMFAKPGKKNELVFYPKKEIMHIEGESDLSEYIRPGESLISCDPIVFISPDNEKMLISNLSTGQYNVYNFKTKKLKNMNMPEEQLGGHILHKLILPEVLWSKDSQLISYYNGELCEEIWVADLNGNKKRLIRNPSYFKATLLDTHSSVPDDLITRTTYIKSEDFDRYEEAIFKIHEKDWKNNFIIISPTEATGTIMKDKQFRLVNYTLDYEK